MPEPSRKSQVVRLKNEKPFLLFRPSVAEADLAFYRDYDPEFLLKKAVCLAAIYKQPEAFADVMQWPHDEFRETFLGSIATELHCAAFHQCEALLALILASYQDRPAWVYLSTYGTKEIKDAAQSLVDGDVAKLNRGAHESLAEVLAAAIYAGCKPDSDEAAFSQSISDIGWFLEQYADSYLKGAEYNANTLPIWDFALDRTGIAGDRAFCFPPLVLDVLASSSALPKIFSSHCRTGRSVGGCHRMADPPAIRCGPQGLLRGPSRGVPSPVIPGALPMGVAPFHVKNTGSFLGGERAGTNRSAIRRTACIFGRPAATFRAGPR